MTAHPMAVGDGTHGPIGAGVQAVRLVQAGEGASRPLVVGFLLGAQLDPQFRTLFGATPCMVAWQGFGAPEPGAQLIAEYEAVARKAGWDGTGDIYFVGWSLGCSRIRSVLPALHGKPRAVLCLDGTTASWPTPLPGQRDVWQELVRGARAGELTAVLTCTSMGYTEHLKAPETPYWATLHMLRDVTGWPLDVARTPDAEDGDVGVSSDGELHVVRFASSDCDKQAHGDQQNKVLFWAARRWLLPLMAGTSATDPAPAPEPGHPLSALDYARLEFAAGVHEDPPHSNTSPRIREYLALCIRNGSLLKLTAGEWCAAFFCWCDHEAGGSIPPRVAVSEVYHDALVAGLVREGSATPKPGWGAIYARAGEDPRTGGHGHIGRVNTVHDDGTYLNIEGNHGDKVDEVPHKPGEALVWIAVDEEPVVYDEATTARLFALVDTIAAGTADTDLDRIETA